MYCTTLSLFLAVESICYPILSWVPFYSWIRFGVHLYLVLPGKQGSVYIYQAYIHPYLEQHEREIDRFITNSHDKARKAGLQYVEQAIEYVKVNVLGMRPRQATPPSSSNASYAQSLIGRFNMPGVGAGLAPAGASDLFSVLGNVMQQSTYPSSSSRGAQADDLAASGNLIPSHLSGSDKTQYISTQRDRLHTLLQALDKEAYEAESSSSGQHGLAQNSPPRSRGPSENLTKSKSELDFEHLGYEDVPQGIKRNVQGIQGAAAGWGKWVWGNYGEKDSALTGKKEQ